MQAKIEAGEKITFDDMIAIQQDSVDTNARRDTPLIIKAAEQVIEDYSEER